MKKIASMLSYLSLIKGVFIVALLVVLSILGIGSADHYIRTHPELSEAHLADLSEQLLLLCSWRNAATLSIITGSDQKNVGFLQSSPPVLRFLVVFLLAYRLASDRESILLALQNVVIYLLWRYKESNGPLSAHIYIPETTRQGLSGISSEVNLSSHVYLIISAVELLIALLLTRSLLLDWQHGRGTSSDSDSSSTTELNSLAENVASSIVNATRAAALLDEKGLSPDILQKREGGQSNYQNIDDEAERQASKLVHANIVTSHAHSQPHISSSSTTTSTLTSSSHMSRNNPLNSHIVDVKQQLSALSAGLSEPVKLNNASLDASIDEIRLQASRERRAALNERRRTILSTVIES